MKMKTFRASTMREAMSQVKAALGGDAVILSSRELGSGKVELVAALDSEPSPPVRRRVRGAEPDATIEPSPLAPEPEALRAMHVELQEMRLELARLRSERGATARSTHEWSRLMSELKELGRLMGARGMAVQDANDALVTRLMAGGVEIGLARTLATQATELAGAGASDAHRTRAAATVIQKAFDPAPPMWERDAHTVAAFVGPTGVGKTTTLAKVAAIASLQHGMSVALVAADTYRIGAVDQVRTYADLLGLPCVVAPGAAEVRQALSRFAHKDLVLVDTAGGNPWQDATLQRTDELLGGLPIERHLCVTAGSSGADLGRITQRYGQSGIRSLVVTKLDEARAIGGVLSTLCGTDYQIALVSTGQEVPGDLERPSAARLCQAVLG